MSIKYVNPRSKAGLDKLIDESIKSYTSGKVAAQVAAVAILSHIARHGDWMLEQVNRLCVGIDQPTMVNYFVKYGGFTYGDGDEEFTGWGGVEKVKVMLDSAKKEMWWNCGKAKTFGTKSLDADAVKLINRYKTGIKNAAKLEREGKEHDEYDTTLSAGTVTQLLRLGDLDPHLLITEEPASNDDADETQEAASMAG